MPESELECSYRYDVKRGLGRISIYGCLEDGLMSVAIVSRSLNPLRGRASLKLSIDATKALLDAGMEEVTIEDIQKLELQRDQKRAEQIAAAYRHLLHNFQPTTLQSPGGWARR